MKGEYSMEEFKEGTKEFKLAEDAARAIHDMPWGSEEMEKAQRNLKTQLVSEHGPDNEAVQKLIYYHLSR